MAQVDEYTVPSTSPLTMTALKAALDAMFAAAVTCNRGADGAAEPQVGMLQWFTSAETETLKVYASDGWKSILFFNTSTGAITFMATPMARPCIRRLFELCLTMPRLQRL